MPTSEYTRSELLAWVNEILALDLNKIEQLGPGAVYCQIFDTIYGDVPLNKVKFDSVLEYEYVSNYKVLQSVFTKHGISKPIPVEKLIKCKFQDNYEFLNWVKGFWDLRVPIADYDPIERRKNTKPPLVSKSRSGSRGASPKGSPRITSALSLNSITPSMERSTSVSGSIRSLKANRPKSSNGSRIVPRGGSPATNSSSPAHNRVNNGSMSPPSLNLKSSQSLGEHLEEHERILHQQQLLQVKLELSNLSKERNFYYSKLRNIELLVGKVENKEYDKGIEDFAAQVKQVLYALEDGFEIPKQQAGDSERASKDGPSSLGGLKNRPPTGYSRPNAKDIFETEDLNMGEPSQGDKKRTDNNISSISPLQMDISSSPALPDDLELTF